MQQDFKYNLNAFFFVHRWAEKELNMMSHFFINLVHYTERVQAGERNLMLV
jgi:hypothetical protein